MTNLPNQFNNKSGQNHPFVNKLTTDAPVRPCMAHFFSEIAACAAASLAIGTLNGEQET